MIQTMQYQDGQIELPVYAASGSELTAGQGLKWGTMAGTYDSANIGAMISAGDDGGADIFAVLQDTVGTGLQASNPQTPIIYRARVSLVDNPKIYKIYYDMSTATDLAVSSATSTIVTTATHDHDQEGGWLYVNAGTGAGQLRYIKAGDATHWTVNTAFTTTLDSTSTLILIRYPGFPVGGHTLNSTYDKLLPVLNATNTFEICVLKNFVEGATGPAELDITLNPHLEQDGLNSRGVRFYSLIMFMDSAYAATGL